MSHQKDLETGIVKWFAETKGYGFLTSPAHSGDLFFHARDYSGSAVPKAGDAVEFVLGGGRDGRPAAKQVRFLSAGERQEHRPYFGKATEKTTHGGVSGAAVGLLIGSVLGPVGAIVGAVLGASVKNTEPITDTCLRCGGVGNVTAITPQYIGFQCKKCRAFWKKRNRDDLKPEQVSHSAKDSDVR